MDKNVPSLSLFFCFFTVAGGSCCCSSRGRGEPANGGCRKRGTDESGGGRRLVRPLPFPLCRHKRLRSRSWEAQASEEKKVVRFEARPVIGGESWFRWDYSFWLRSPHALAALQRPAVAVAVEFRSWYVGRHFIWGGWWNFDSVSELKGGWYQCSPSRGLWV